MSDDDIHFFAKQAKLYDAWRYIEDTFLFWKNFRRYKKLARQWHATPAGKKWCKQYAKKRKIGKSR